MVSGYIYRLKNDLEETTTHKDNATMELEFMQKRVEEASKSETDLKDQLRKTREELATALASKNTSSGAALC